MNAVRRLFQNDREKDKKKPVSRDGLLFKKPLYGTIRGEFSFDFDIEQVDKKIKHNLKDLKGPVGEINNYLRDCSEFLETYRNLSSKINKIVTEDIILNDNILEIPPEHRILLEKRASCINYYLTLASKYIHIEVSYIDKFPETVCCFCHNPMLKSDNEGNIIVCEECGAENTQQVVPKKNIEFMFNNINGDSQNNFMKCFDRFCGISNDVDIKNITEELDKFFDQKKIFRGDFFKKLPYDYRGRKEGTSHQMLYNALKEINRSENYQDCDYIGFVYWGWRLPDAQHLREIIKKDFIETEAAYDEIPREERGRESSLGTQYRLWRHLQLRRFECYPSEFRIAENQTSLQNHHRLWKIMCDRCSNPNIYYIENTHQIPSDNFFKSDIL